MKMDGWMHISNFVIIVINFVIPCSTNNMTLKLLQTQQYCLVFRKAMKIHLIILWLSFGINHP